MCFVVNVYYFGGKHLHENVIIYLWCTTLLGQQCHVTAEKTQTYSLLNIPEASFSSAHGINCGYTKKNGKETESISKLEKQSAFYFFSVWVFPVFPQKVCDSLRLLAKVHFQRKTNNREMVKLSFI
jgi:hypothetical protein